jgi:hypothetical protein
VTPFDPRHQRRRWIVAAILVLYTGVGIALFAAFGFATFLAFIAAAWVLLEVVSIVLRRRKP